MLRIITRKKYNLSILGNNYKYHGHFLRTFEARQLTHMVIMETGLEWLGSFLKLVHHN